MRSIWSRWTGTDECWNRKQASIPYGTSALPWILARLMPICDAMCTNRFWVQIALTVFISRWDSLEIYEVFHGDWNIDGLIDRFRVILEVCGSIWIAFDVHWCAGASWDRRCGDEIAGWRSLEPWTWHRAHIHSRPHGGTYFLTDQTKWSYEQNFQT